MNLRQAPFRSSITRLLSFLGGLASLMIALSIPLLYLGFSLYSIQKTMLAETAYLARSVERIVQARPDMWEFESERLQEMIAQPSINHRGLERSVYTTTDELVAKSGASVVRPVLVVSVPFYDSGRPAGSLMTKISIRRELVITALLGGASTLLGFLIYFLFITFPIRKLDHVLAELHRGKERSEKTLYAIGDGVISINAAGKIELINQVAGSLIGIRTEEAVGKPLDEVYTRIRRTERQNGGDKTLTILVSRKGTEYIVEEEHTSLPEMESDQSGTVIIFRDITERHRAEEALKDSRDSLESAYNALKLTQSRLLQQEKMASIGQLAAGVAHEINNPMGFISSNLRSLEKYIVKIVAYTSGMEAMLAREKTDANVKALKEKRSALQMDFIIQDIKDLIDESLEGAERVKKIVQNLKTFARLDHDDHKQADINKCIESSLNMVWNELKYKATIIKDYGEIPQTLCYPMQLNQVFVNLLVNAAHAIERQGEITVRTWAEKGSICASVTDTGCGMTQETMDHIFEPFFSTKEIGQGTGLGLSIVYDIIIKHGGEIAVLSTPGNGTTFTVHLPIVEG